MLLYKYYRKREVGKKGAEKGREEGMISTGKISLKLINFPHCYADFTSACTVVDLLQSVNSLNHANIQCLIMNYRTVVHVITHL